MSSDKPTEQPAENAATATATTSADEVEGVMPTFNTEEERQTFNASLMAQLAPRPLNSASTPAPEVGDVSAHINDSSRTNKHTIRCRFCDDKVLTPDSATYESQSHSLHLLGGAKTDTTREALTDWWYVSSQMNFYNVGVTRGIDPTYRYLTCSNCDRGPIGINYLNEPTKFYVAHQRIKYDQQDLTQ